MKTSREKIVEMHIEQLSADNRHQFLDFFRRNNSENTRRNFHPFAFSNGALEEVFRSLHKDLFFGVFGRDNKIIGFGMLRGWDEGYEVPSLGVLIDEEMRGSGIGARLVEFLVSVARDSGARRVRLSVYSDNKRAISIYNKCGFKTTKKKEVSGRIKWIMYCDVN